MHKAVIPYIIAAILTICPFPSLAAPSPTVQVKQTVETIILMLKNNDLNKDTRREKIATLIKERFDFRVMSRRVLAINWKHATPAQKDRFISLFTDLLKNTYMERIEAYTDEKVKFVKEKRRGKKALVDTLIVTESVEIPIRYKVFLKKGEWLIYDVVIEEVSLTRNYRSSYKEIVKKEGIDGLIIKMEKKINNSEKDKKK
jgi:phospholipid transport system substrate-binding protein